ncbi:hypothetical protein [Streptomyces broussonetiae]|nr:hypothetical protein [Streptomyces broussonetiae]
MRITETVAALTLRTAAEQVSCVRAPRPALHLASTAPGLALPSAD